jgi:hypothetical protein
MAHKLVQDKVDMIVYIDDWNRGCRHGGARASQCVFKRANHCWSRVLDSGINLRASVRLSELTAKRLNY